MGDCPCWVDADEWRIGILRRLSRRVRDHCRHVQPQRRLFPGPNALVSPPTRSRRWPGRACCRPARVVVNVVNGEHPTVGAGCSRRRCDERRNLPDSESQGRSFLESRCSRCPRAPRYSKNHNSIPGWAHGGGSTDVRAATACTQDVQGVDRAG